MNDTEFLSVAIFPRAAVSAQTTPCGYWRPNQRVRILRSYLVATTAKPYTNVASYGTVNLINGGTTAAGTTVVAHRHYGGATVDAITAGIPYALDLNATEEELEIDDDEVLIVNFTETGTATCGDFTFAAVYVDYVPGYGGGI
jgi:hypothetical protein